MLIVDVGIQTREGYSPYVSGSTYDLWVKNRMGEPLLGSTPEVVNFPDWFHPKSQGVKLT